MGICFPYLGEFQPTKYREKILCWMEMFWTVGIIALPGMQEKKKTRGSYLVVVSDFVKIFAHIRLIFVLICLGIAWLIIPLEVEIKHGWFLFHSWNLFVAICAIPR